MIRIITLAEFDDETLELVARKLQNAYGVGAEISRQVFFEVDVVLQFLFVREVLESVDQHMTHDDSGVDYWKGEV